MSLTTSARGDKPGSSQLTLEQRRELRSEAVQSLAALIRSTSAVDGGFRASLDELGSPGDVWTLAQCILGLLASTGSDEFRDDIREGLAFISKARRGDAWAPDQEPLIETTSWVGLAFLGALHDSEILQSGPERENAIREVQFVHKYLAQRQSPQGGWGSHETYYERPGAFTDYATFIALRFLVRLRQVRPYALNLLMLDEQIQRGFSWILARYDPGISGWKEYSSGVGVQKDLATLYLLLFMEAKRSGFEFMSSDPRFLDAVAAWIPSALNDSRNRKIAENTDLRQAQDIYDEFGRRVRGEYLAVSILWHPWSLLLANYLSLDASLPSGQKSQVLDLEDRLFRRLPEAVSTFSKGFIFQAAEMMYALGSVQ